MSFQETFPLKDRRVWVTGGTGFLGRAVVAELLRRGAKPMATGRREVDLLDPGAAEAFLDRERPEGVIHLAGIVGGIGANRRQPGTFFYANMVMGLHLIEACRRKETPKLLVAGTVCATRNTVPYPFVKSTSGMATPKRPTHPTGWQRRPCSSSCRATGKSSG